MRDRKEYLKEYNQKNREKITKRVKLWRLNNPEKVKAITKRYREKSRPKYNLNAKRWGLSMKGIYNNLKGRTRKQNIPVDVSQQDFISWYSSQEQKCYYCSIPLDILTKNINLKKIFNFNKFRFSIDRKDNKGSYNLENIVLSCARCNTFKGFLFSSFEMKEIAQKYLKPKWEEEIKGDLKNGN